MHPCGRGHLCLHSVWSSASGRVVAATTRPPHPIRGTSIARRKRRRGPGVHLLADHHLGLGAQTGTQRRSPPWSRAGTALVVLLVGTVGDWDEVEDALWGGVHRLASWRASVRRAGSRSGSGRPRAGPLSVRRALPATREERSPEGADSGLVSRAPAGPEQAGPWREAGRAASRGLPPRTSISGGGDQGPVRVAPFTTVSACPNGLRRTLMPGEGRAPRREAGSARATTDAPREARCGAAMPARTPHAAATGSHDQRRGHGASRLAHRRCRCRVASRDPGSR